MDIFPKVKTGIVAAVIFLFPFFFLPFTAEIFLTNKLYLLAFASLALLLVSTGEFLVSRQFVWEKKAFDNGVLLFFVTVALSVLISSPNKIQALLNPNFGVVTVFSLSVLYYYISRNARNIKGFNIMDAGLVSSIIAGLLAIVFYFQPFKNITLPVGLQFLKTPGFTTVGDQLTLIIYLGFFVVFSLSQLLKTRQKNAESEASALSANITSLNTLHGMLLLASVVLPLAGLGISVLGLYQQSNHFAGLLLPPYRISWYAAVEILKNPFTAVVGVGVDNFAAIFTQTKDGLYNQSNLWQVQAFAVSRSAILHIMTEAGIFGLIAFGFLFMHLIKRGFETASTHFNIRHLSFSLTSIYLLIALLFFPPALPLLVLFYLTLGEVAAQTPVMSGAERKAVTRVDLTELIPVYLGVPLVAIVFVIILAYLLGRSYVAEYHYKRSLDGLNGKANINSYEELRSAVLTNPFMEKFRVDFSRVNLLLANNIAQKDPKKISDQDRQTIAQAIQSAIAEAKSAVALNPQKSTNWENLATIYRNILTVAQGADVWTISSYQRAIVSDPQNPSYRLNLGGIYYSLANYNEALKMFEQTVALKPDWANAHYNLAWTAYQTKDYQRAAVEMQNVLLLLNPKTDANDIKRAQSELDKFKAMLPKENVSGTPTPTPAAQQLSLPTPASATLEPKIKLPKTASPEAK